MPEIDLVDWTIQEAQHLKTERREPGDVNDKSSLDKLLAVLEREPALRTYPEGAVALIASISARSARPKRPNTKERAPTTISQWRQFHE